MWDMSLQHRLAHSGSIVTLKAHLVEFSADRVNWEQQWVFVGLPFFLAQPLVFSLTIELSCKGPGSKCLEFLGYHKIMAKPEVLVLISWLLKTKVELKVRCVTHVCGTIPVPILGSFGTDVITWEGITFPCTCLVTSQVLTTFLYPLPSTSPGLLKYHLYIILACLSHIFITYCMVPKPLIP